MPKKYFLIVGGCVFLVSICCFIFFGSKYRGIFTHDVLNISSINQEAQKPLFAILPHFMINQAKVDEFYEMIKNKVGPDVKHIILVTPNHFGLGGGAADIFCHLGNTKSKAVDQVSILCFESWCVKVGDIRKIANSKIRNGQNESIFQKFPFGCGISSLSANGFFDLWTLQQENFAFNKEHRVFMTSEHGLGEHFRFINRYFPDATVYPLVLGAKNMSVAQALISYYFSILSKIQEKVLVIASVDFSHYVPEDFAQVHDATTIFTLQDDQATIDEYRNLEVDCPSCLWFTVSLARKYGYKPYVRWRDSSQSLYGSKDNTSRLFFTFFPFSGNFLGDKNVRSFIENDDFEEEVRKKDQPFKKSEYFDFLDFFTKRNGQSGYTFFFVGDTMYDRLVAKMLPTEQALLMRFSGLNQKLQGIDMALANLEGPLGETPQDCRKLPKTIAFCAHRRLIDVLKKIGFDAVSIANNHIRDTGIHGFEVTKRILQDAGISFFGNLGSYGRLDESYVLTGEKRGIRFVWLGYDLTISQRHTDTYCKEISTYAKDGYIPLVSVHWGSEYEPKQNYFQEKVAHMFADCGARLIIGHHPHVIQGIERYIPCTSIESTKVCNASENVVVPIIYSLGNFLFDQGWSESTKKGMYSMGILTASGVVYIRTGEVNAYFQTEEKGQ